jgi:hypothetical protein
MERMRISLPDGHAAADIQRMVEALIQFQAPSAVAT